MFRGGGARGRGGQRSLAEAGEQGGGGERQDQTVKDLIGHRKEFHYYSTLSDK